MVSSLDGMIAKTDNSISWFETTDSYEKGVTGEDTAEFLKKIDCYIMGSRTYELALELSKSYGWAYGDTPTFVFTHRDLPLPRPNVQLYGGDSQQLVNERLKPAYKNVWLVGGPTLAKDFMRLNLIDEIRMTILPIVLGDGIPFFEGPGQEQPLHLIDTTAYKNGLVELRYEIKK